VSTYQSPGVYIQEVPSGPQPIAAASTSVIAILGPARRGPALVPTRVTGWGEYLGTFGGHLYGHYTAESVYGFFENGGPAAYIVRVDPSIAAEWTVNDANDDELFRIQASFAGSEESQVSPGAWANELSVQVTPDETSGSGQLSISVVTRDKNVPSASSTAVDVGSTVGMAVTDEVVLLKRDGTSATAVIDAISPTSLTVTKEGAGAIALEEGDVIARVIDGAATAVALAAGSGIRAGDLVVAELPNRTRLAALVNAAVSQGASLTLTLDDGFGTDVPGAQFAPRTARFRGTITPTDETIALGEITWTEDEAVRPAVGDIGGPAYRAYAANGLQGAWDPSVGAGAFRFPSTPPAGDLEVEANLRVHRFSEAVDLINPTLEALAGRFGFVPEGTRMKLTGAGTTEATLTRTATGFTTGDSLTATFTSAEFLLPDDASKGVVVRCARDPEAGDVVRFGTNNLVVSDVAAIGGTLYVLDFTATTNLSAVTGTSFALSAVSNTRLYPLRFAITVGGGTVGETFTGLALHPSHPKYYFKEQLINGVSQFIRVTERDTTVALTEDLLPTSVMRTRDGADREPQPADYKNALPTLEAESEPATVICPETVGFDDLVAADLIGAIVSHCESFRRLAVVDAPRKPNDQALADWRNQSVASTYAAVYAPFVRMLSLDPASVEAFVDVPPSGFVAGVMARTDRERGVHKAPGNERVRGIVGPVEVYTQRRQDLLNPNAVNLIRSFPGRGIRIWGARNATDDVQWRYTNVRRLFNFMETSVERGTQWVVFEPNTPTTWLRVKVTVENFLDQVWRAGGLAGSTPAEAYRVRVGLGETMTETDIDLGLIIIEVAVAPAKPAEFVVFRFSHKQLAT
jgi:phage tail sheath protein FI